MIIIILKIFDVMEDDNYSYMCMDCDLEGDILECNFELDYNEFIGK